MSSKLKALTFFSIVLFLFYCTHRNPEKSSQLSQNQDQGIKPAITQKTDTTFHKYSIKSGIITFETEIAGTKGKKIQYFDDFGKKEREDFYEDNKLTESTLTSGSTLYKIRFADKTAVNMGISQNGTAFRVDWDNIPIKQKRDGYAIKSDNMKIAGKDCQCYRIDNSGIITTFAGWDGICLYSNQQSKQGNALTKAISIEENSDIPSNTFKLPKGIRVK